MCKIRIASLIPDQQSFPVLWQKQNHFLFMPIMASMSFISQQAITNWVTYITQEINGTLQVETLQDPCKRSLQVASTMARVGPSKDGLSDIFQKRNIDGIYSNCITNATCVSVYNVFESCCLDVALVICMVTLTACRHIRTRHYKVYNLFR